MSKKYSFPYLKTPRFKNINGDWRKKPLMPITIRHKGITVSYLVLVDSGADFNVFHGDIASLLGIDLKTLKNKIPFGGIKKDNSPCMGHIASVELGIGKDFFDNALVIFSNDISSDGYGILGQFGFFNYFNVMFDRSKYSFQLIKKG